MDGEASLMSMCISGMWIYINPYMVTTCVKGTIACEDTLISKKYSYCKIWTYHAQLQDPADDVYTMRIIRVNLCLDVLKMVCVQSFTLQHRYFRDYGSPRIYPTVRVLAFCWSATVSKICCSSTIVMAVLARPDIDPFRISKLIHPLLLRLSVAYWKSITRLTSVIYSATQRYIMVWEGVSQVVVILKTVC